MDYPTREQAQRLASNDCVGGPGDVCATCDIAIWCGADFETVLSCGEAMVKMHDEIEAKQAELDKAKGLIRDVVAWANSEERPEEEVEIYNLIEKAEAMTGGTK